MIFPANRADAIPLFQAVEDGPFASLTVEFQKAYVIDLLKDREVLRRAYDDALGGTAAFNRNILRNVNRSIGSDFDPAQWQHVALFNEVQSRVEMHLQASQDLVVRWAEGERRFRAGERIHTESACKYTVERFEAMLRHAGFRAVRHWSDDDGLYAVFHAVN